MKSLLIYAALGAALLAQHEVGHAQSAGVLTSALGKPSRMLVGLGAGNPIATMNSQGIRPDIVDTYLVGVGSGQWPSWNSPSGSYVTSTAAQADSLGAVPMYTLYQMATNGDGSISDISDATFMTTYWSQVRLMYQKIGAFGKPTLVNLEPDFWGYVQGKAPNGDPTQLYAYVNGAPECASLPNTAAGIAQCLVRMGRTYAPKAKLGFPPSIWNGNAANTAAFMVKLGAASADFIVAQTSDRDAGCMEVVPPLPQCSGRGNGPFYWDESNKTSPTYSQSISDWSTVSKAENNLPILYWQTPMGVPSSSRGGTAEHFRDNHVHYMLGNASQFAAINVFAVVFSAGSNAQTTISTDGGQFKSAYANYLASPAWFSSGGIANGTYRIINRNSGLSLDDSAWQVGTTAKPAVVQQYAYSGGANQRWVVTSIGNGQYTIFNLNANQPLDVYNFGGSGAAVDLVPSTNGANQHWIIAPTDNGYFTLAPAHTSGVVLDVKGNSTANGGAVEIWLTNGGWNQQWAFQAP
jgi:hypothetical protein